MVSGGMALSATLGKSNKIEIDREVAESIYNDLLSLWNELPRTDRVSSSKAYGLYMSILERYKEDILNDR